MAPVRIPHTPEIDLRIQEQERFVERLQGAIDSAYGRFTNPALRMGVPILGGLEDRTRLVQAAIDGYNRPRNIQLPPSPLQQGTSHVFNQLRTEQNPAVVAQLQQEISDALYDHIVRLNGAEPAIPVIGMAAAPVLAPAAQGIPAQGAAVQRRAIGLAANAVFNAPPGAITAGTDTAITLLAPVAAAAPLRVLTLPAAANLDGQVQQIRNNFQQQLQKIRAQFRPAPVAPAPQQNPPAMPGRPAAPGGNNLPPAPMGPILSQLGDLPPPLANMGTGSAVNYSIA